MGIFGNFRQVRPCETAKNLTFFYFNSFATNLQFHVCQGMSAEQNVAMETILEKIAFLLFFLVLYRDNTKYCNFPARETLHHGLRHYWMDKVDRHAQIQRKCFSQSFGVEKNGIKTEILEIGHFWQFRQVRLCETAKTLSFFYFNSFLRQIFSFMSVRYATAVHWDVI